MLPLLSHWAVNLFILHAQQQPWISFMHFPAVIDEWKTCANWSILPEVAVCQSLRRTGDQKLIILRPIGWHWNTSLQARLSIIEPLNFSSFCLSGHELHQDRNIVDIMFSHVFIDQYSCTNNNNKRSIFREISDYICLFFQVKSSDFLSFYQCKTFQQLLQKTSSYWKVVSFEPMGGF